MPSDRPFKQRRSFGKASFIRAVSAQVCLFIRFVFVPGLLAAGWHSFTVSYKASHAYETILEIHLSKTIFNQTDRGQLVSSEPAWPIGLLFQ